MPDAISIPRKLLAWTDIEAPKIEVTVYGVRDVHPDDFNGIVAANYVPVEEIDRMFRHDETERAHYAAEHADELRDRDRPGK